MGHIVIGTEPCGCKVIKHHDKHMNPFIAYCPLHKSAIDLHEACEEMLDFIRRYGGQRHLSDFPEDCAHCHLIKNAGQALPKAGKQC